MAAKVLFFKFQPVEGVGKEWAAGWAPWNWRDTCSATVKPVKWHKSVKLQIDDEMNVS